MICEIAGWVLGGMLFGVLVQVLFWGAGAGAVGGTGVGALWAHFCEIHRLGAGAGAVLGR